jgi:uncharacterized paraquat-inducible protein A
LLIYLLLVPVVLLSVRLRSKIALAAGFTILWLLLSMLIIVFGVLDLQRRRAWRRYYAGQCVRCGYDLRATPNRCPECGAMPFKPKLSMLKSRRL